MIILIWALTGVIAYGWMFGYCQVNYWETARECYGKDMRVSILIGSLGLLGLIGVAGACIVNTPRVRRFAFKLF